LNLGRTSSALFKLSSANFIWGVLIKRDLENRWQGWLVGTRFQANEVMGKYTKGKSDNEGLLKEVYRRILHDVDCDYLLKFIVCGTKTVVTKIIDHLVLNDNRLISTDYGQSDTCFVLVEKLMFKIVFRDMNKERIKWAVIDSDVKSSEKVALASTDGIIYYYNSKASEGDLNTLLSFAPKHCVTVGFCPSKDHAAKKNLLFSVPPFDIVRGIDLDNLEEISIPFQESVELLSRKIQDMSKSPITFSPPREPPKVKPCIIS